MKTKRLQYRVRGFTLIEIMVVVAIMAVILATGIPAIYRMNKREGMRQAVKEIDDACRNARMQAIFSGTPVDVIFHPLEKRFEVSGAGGASRSDSGPRFDNNGELIVEKPPPAPSEGLAGQFSDDITIEMLDINLQEFNQSEWARVRFYPNGTSDELNLILFSDKGERRRIRLEVTTGLMTSSEKLQ